ncbi:filamentous hemagglutinin N-terminal domain-containing protein, partial [Azospirillum sp. TSO22-1]|uniref:beta strand repeat-containing protein n=1 Tax=Azospirillum sp. TSO22-1 TaxID=716789 RepID=UPI000D6178F4
MKKPNRKSGRTRNRRKARSVTLAAGAALMLPVAALPALAGPPQGNPPAVNQLPTGGVVAAGTAGIAQSGTQLTVTQTSPRAVVNWETFNVGANAAVTFRQPDAGSATLNRVTDPNPSQIYGRIQANGQVFLTNPNGVYFAPGSSVDVGGLVATTHAIRDADFMAGKTTLERNGATGRVTNDGTLTASLGGYIALLAPEVRNNGVIVARMGTVALAAGEAYTLKFSGDGTLADVQVAPATVKALVRNRHAVQAPGGLIILSAQAVNQLRGSVVNSGQLEASGLVSDGGTIRLRASNDVTVGGNLSADAAPGGTGKGGSVTAIADLNARNSRTTVKGTVSARGGGKGGDGGFVETSGGRVRIKDTARVDTRAARGKAGQWLIDPDGFTIASSGGDITGTALSANLATGDVSILSTNGSGSDGNVNVNDAVTWSANKLTLTATNDVNINAVMTAKGTAKLDLEPGSGKVNVGFNSDGTFKGRVDFFQADGTTARSGTGFLTIGGDDFTVITSVGTSGSATGTDLQGINFRPGDKYALGANIDASATSGWASGAGFSPIGLVGDFTGIFDGLGHTVNGLAINRPSTASVGMFSYGKGATVRNVGITGGSIIGGANTGALLGRADASSTISNVYSTAPVTGGSSTGGLIGYLYGGTLSKSYASGTVSGGDNVGGLIGQADTPTIATSFSTGAVSGGSYVGGLIGVQSGGSLSDVYATGAVTATGNKVGGLLGANAGTTVSRGLAANSITASGSNVGALVGVQTSGSVANSFYDSTLAGARTGFGDGTADSTGVVLGKTTTQLRNVATYEAAGWSIGVDTTLSSGYASHGFLQGTSSTTWVIGNLPVYVRLVAGSSTYGDTPGFTYAIYDASSGGNLITDVTGSGTATWSTPLTGTLSAGTYGETYAGGLTASRTGYTFTAGGAANWTISPRAITVQASDQSRVYGAGNPSSGGAALVSGSLVNGDTLGSVTLTSSATGSTAAGQTAALTPGSLTMSSGNASNYAVTYTNGTLSIGKAPLTVTANDVGKVYDGQAYSGNGGVSYGGFVNGEGASVLGGTLSYGGSSQGAVNAGSYAITPSGLSASNYTIAYTGGTLTINKAPLTIAAGGLTKTYDGQTFSGGTGVSYSGFVNGEGTSVLGGTLSYGGSSQGAVNAG